VLLENRGRFLCVVTIFLTVCGGYGCGESINISHRIPPLHVPMRGFRLLLEFVFELYLVQALVQVEDTVDAPKTA
jgi:hypothetical protein